MLKSWIRCSLVFAFFWVGFSPYGAIAQPQSQIQPQYVPDSYVVEVVENPISIDRMSESEKQFLDAHLKKLREFSEETMEDLSAYDAHELEHLFEQGNPYVRGKFQRRGRL